MLKSPSKAVLPIQWNGGEIGDITHLVINRTPMDHKLLLTFADGTKAHITKYIGTLPLIADELKAIFGLDKIGRCGCYYLGERAIIHRHHSDEYLLETVDFPISLDEVKRVFVYRWFLGMTLNFQRCIIVKRYRSGIARVTSYNDTNYDFTNHTSRGSEIPGTIVKRWFEADYDLVARKMLEGLTFQQIRTMITAVINRIDPQHNYWIISIMSRIGRYVEVETPPALSPQTIVSGGVPNVPSSMFPPVPKITLLPVKTLPIPESLPSPTAPPRSILSFSDAGPIGPIESILNLPLPDPPVTPRQYIQYAPLELPSTPLRTFGLATPRRGAHQHVVCDEFLVTTLKIEQPMSEDVTFLEIESEKDSSSES